VRLYNPDLAGLKLELPPGISHFERGYCWQGSQGHFCGLSASIVNKFETSEIDSHGGWL
jgi:hypothetical protein